MSRDFLDFPCLSYVAVIRNGLQLCIYNTEVKVYNVSCVKSPGLHIRTMMMMSNQTFLHTNKPTKIKSILSLNQTFLHTNKPTKKSNQTFLHTNKPTKIKSIVSLNAIYITPWAENCKRSWKIKSWTHWISHRKVLEEARHKQTIWYVLKRPVLSYYKL